MDPAAVCGLITERGEKARRAVYERAWERDAAVWRAVLQALEDAAKGVRPAKPCTRPPAWLTAAVKGRLQTMATRWSQDSVFGDIRTLERLGLVQLEPDDTYILAAVGGIGDRFRPSWATTLRDDPELIDRVVWRMFEVEGGGEVSLANVDKYSAQDAGWKAAFVELTADGTLPRERVLTSCLSALNRDFSAYRAGWYARLYDALEPTVDEMARHQAQVRPLLNGTVASTVSFAVNKLRVLGRHGALDDAATMPALRPAAVAAPKSTAIAAVRLAEAIAKRAPELTRDAADVAAAALEHPNADVQLAAATLLRAVGAADRLAPSVDLLEPSVRTDVLGRRPEPVPQAPASPSLATAPPMRPLPDHDVLDRLAALLEDAGDPLEVELVVAGLARLVDAERLRLLTKRATAILARGPRENVTDLWLRGQLARLVLAAGRAQLPSPPPASSHAVAFLSKRLAVIEDILRGARPPKPLLATPDDPSGWLAPGTLVDRLVRHGEPDGYDFVAALLRMHPDGRDTALRGAGALGGAVGDIVRYGLGGPAPPEPRRRLLGSTAKLRQVAWWIAASRAAMPLGRDDWLAARGVDGAGRSQPIEARVEFRAEPFSWTDRNGVHQSTHWERRVVVAAPTKHPDDREPTAVVERGGARTPDLEDLVGWLALIYPHDCEHFLVTTVDAVLEAATAGEVSHDAVRVLDAVALHPGRLGRLGLTALAAGLTAGKVDQRAHAVDAVLQQQRMGRLTAERLAEGLVAVQGPSTPTRLAAALRDVAASGRHAADLAIDSLAAALPSFDPGRHGIHALLDMLREELLRHGRPTPATLRPWLERFTGTSRASRTAAALLSLS